MATNIIASQTNHITSGTLGNKSATSCGGVPGEGLSSAYIYVNTYITTLLDDDGYLWFANTSGTAQQTGMIDTGGQSSWYIYTVIKNAPFTIAYTGSFESSYAGQYFQKSLWHAQGVSSNFTGSTTYSTSTAVSTVAQAQSLGYWNSGFKVTDFPRVGSTTNVTVYVAYPVSYGEGDTPVQLSALPFSFSFSGILEYFPFAVYSDGWQSCNREGGSLTKYNGSSWGDLKNIEDASDVSTVFNYDGSSWQIAPKIGNE